MPPQNKPMAEIIPHDYNLPVSEVVKRQVSKRDALVNKNSGQVSLTNWGYPGKQRSLQQHDDSQ